MTGSRLCENVVIGLVSMAALWPGGYVSRHSLVVSNRQCSALGMSSHEPPSEAVWKRMMGEKLGRRMIETATVLWVTCRASRERFMKPDRGSCPNYEETKA